MRYLKTYESHESIDSIKNWINEVMANCKDIMIELEDAGMKTNVKRSLYMEERNSVLVDCMMSYKSPYNWRKFGLVDIYDRLSDYMKSEGFEEIQRLLGDVGQFPFTDDGYEGRISFKKSGLDSDYIGHLRYLKKYKLLESSDMKWNDRDVTNKYFTSKGWIRYTDVHQDSYIDIERYFDITFDHLGWILEDLVTNCDLLYSCSVRDKRGLYLSHESSDGMANCITIDLTPEKFERVGGHIGVNFKSYMRKFSHFPPKDDDVLFQLLQDIEDKLEENFTYLTIKDVEGKWNFFLNSSEMKLKIKRND